MNPPKAHSSHQQSHHPQQPPPEHSDHVTLVRHPIGLGVVNTTQCAHPPRGVPPDDIWVVSSEVEGVQKEHSHQKNAHEHAWDGGGGEGGVEEMGGEEGHVGGWQWTTL